MSKKINLPIDEIIVKYKSGMTTKELAIEYFVSPTTIQDRLNKAGVIRKVGRQRVFTDDERLSRRRKYNKKYNASSLAKESHKRRRKKDGQKVRARWTVENNIRSGKMRRVSEFQCTDCDVQAEEYDHYLGYEEKHMLSVQPVCRLCHRNREKARK